MTDTIDVAALVVPLVVLSKFNIPPDTLELLVHGNPSRGIPPGALATALQSQADALAEARRENERLAELAQQYGDALDKAGGKNWVREGALEIAKGQWETRATTAEASLATMREALVIAEAVLRNADPTSTTDGGRIPETTTGEAASIARRALGGTNAE